MGAPLSGMPPKLRVLPRPDLQASHLGGSLETSFENYLWIRGGWLIRACSWLSGPRGTHCAMRGSVCHRWEPTLHSYLGGKPRPSRLWRCLCVVWHLLGGTKGQETRPGFNLALDFPAVRP